ncbi:hypothetical protein B0H13DRAFT_2006117 [Mycena leptocephala]|nr:hypothetical protein B0H13DRAFT_2006117 [Mycena leptocephala]
MCVSSFCDALVPLTSLEVHQDMRILRPLHPLSCAGTTTTRTANHARTYPPPPMSFVLDLASFISLRLVQAEARSAGALAGCVCNERASERWVLQWWRRGEVLEGERAATSSRHRIFEDAGCGRASILSTRRSKARRSMSGRRQICDWRCYRHGGHHVWVRLVVIRRFSISRRMSSRRTYVSGRLCSALLCDR